MASAGTNGVLLALMNKFNLPD